jgi:hypothetical protein
MQVITSLKWNKPLLILYVITNVIVTTSPLVIQKKSELKDHNSSVAC